MKRYKLLCDHHLLSGTLKKGSTLYECLKHDFGLCSNHFRISREVHVFVTKSRKGDYPGYSIPLSKLKEIQ